MRRTCWHTKDYLLGGLLTLRRSRFSPMLNLAFYSINCLSNESRRWTSNLAGIPHVKDWICWLPIRCDPHSGSMCQWKRKRLSKQVKTWCYVIALNVSTSFLLEQLKNFSCKRFACFFNVCLLLAFRSFSSESESRARIDEAIRIRFFT